MVEAVSIITEEMVEKAARYHRLACSHVQSEVAAMEVVLRYILPDILEAATKVADEAIREPYDSDYGQGGADRAREIGDAIRALAQSQDET